MVNLRLPSPTKLYSRLAVQLISRIRQWWQSRPADDAAWDTDTPAWLVSLLAHLGLLIALTLLMISGPEKDKLFTVVSSSMVEEDPLVTSEEFAPSDVPEETIGALGSAEISSTIAVAPVLSLTPTPESVEIEPQPYVTQPVAMQEEIRMATGPKFAENLTIKGAAGVGAVGTGGAIDRITQEILLSLEERRTLVVWLFDQSGSLATSGQKSSNGSTASTTSWA